MYEHGHVPTTSQEACNGGVCFGFFPLKAVESRGIGREEKRTMAATRGHSAHDSVSMRIIPPLLRILLK